MMFPDDEICVKDRVKNAFSHRLPFGPFSLNRVSLTTSSSLMVVPDFFIFFVDNHIDCRVMVFYRYRGAQAADASANNVNLYRSHQPYRT